MGSERVTVDTHADEPGVRRRPLLPTPPASSTTRASRRPGGRLPGRPALGAPPQAHGPPTVTSSGRVVSPCWLVPLLGVPLLSRGWGWVLASSALLPEDGLVEPRTPTPAREPARRGRPRTAPGRQLHPAGHPGRRHGRRPDLRSSHGGSTPRWRCGPPAAGIADRPSSVGPTEDRPGSRRNRDGSWRTQTSGQPPPAARPAGALVGQGRADPADPGLADGAAKRPPAHPAAHRLHVESSTTMVP
jgi:hypothetical protein